MTCEKKCHPGTCYKKAIPLCNESQEAIRVKITHVDYLYRASGENHFEALGFNGRTNGSWMTIFPKIVDIPPKQKIFLNCHVAVPKDLSLCGTYWSLLLIEQQPTDVQDEKETESPQLALRTVLRYGFLMVTHVGRQGESKIKILKKKIENRKFCFEYENSGVWVAKPSVSFKIFNTQGDEVYHYSIGCKRLLPGCSARCEIDMGQLPPGLYNSLLLFDQQYSLSGAEYQFSLT